MYVQVFTNKFSVLFLSVIYKCVKFDPGVHRFSARYCFSYRNMLSSFCAKCDIRI